MVVNQKVTGTASAMPVGIGAGVAIGLAVSVGGAGVFGALLSREIVSAASLGYWAMLLILLSSMAASCTAVARIKRQRLMVCGITGALYFLVLVSMTALFFGGQYQWVGVTALLILAGSVAATLLSARPNRKYHYRNRRRGGRKLR